jgi:hypothetical protein
MVQIEGTVASAIDDEDDDEGRFGRRCTKTKLALMGLKPSAESFSPFGFEAARSLRLISGCPPGTGSFVVSVELKDPDGGRENLE